MTPRGAVVLAPGGLGVEEREAPDREGRRGEERRGDGDAKAKHDRPARNLKRSILGSGDDVAAEIDARIVALRAAAGGAF